MYSQNINNIGENFENMKLTPNEQKLFDLFFEDYEYQFENILKISENSIFTSNKILFRRFKSIKKIYELPKFS